MHEQSVAEDRITLTDVAKITPGRPSANCIWRWCRRGVLARNGERVRLEHVRIGGKIFTTRAWLDEFGRRLATADAAYFAAADAAAPASDHEESTTRRSKSKERRQAEIAAAEAELDARGVR